MTANGFNAILAVRGVHKAYAIGKRRLEVLRGVSLEVRPGEFVALRGASGAGKSTLLHLCGGLDRPDQGSIAVGGVTLTDLPGTALSRFRNRRIGLVFQSYHLLPELSAWENVLLPARMARVGFREAQEKSRSLLEKVGLGGRLDHRPSELSGGEQQRVGLARALVNDPDLLLADEPTGNLDSHTGAEVMELLLRLRGERGVTLIIATHDQRVAGRAERIVDLTDGVIAGEGPAAQ
jgi:ABC-type lipoprotein export system ATPase subunit